MCMPHKIININTYNLYSIPDIHCTFPILHCYRVTHVFLVWLGRNPPKQRLSGLQSTVQRLGGRMVPYESGFTRQATHCVIATETADQVSYQAKVGRGTLMSATVVDSKANLFQYSRNWF